MSVVVIASVHGLEGRAHDVRTAVEELATAARAADGCVSFHVAQMLEDPAELLLVGTWRDEASLRAHYASPPYARYADAVGSALARPSDAVIHYVERTTHPVGDPSTEAARQG